jgi:hypothetical protein
MVQLTQRKLADFISNLGILKIEGKKRKRAASAALLIAGESIS